jgi:hypothetical protein
LGFGRGLRNAADLQVSTLRLFPEGVVPTTRPKAVVLSGGSLHGGQTRPSHPAHL